MPQSTNLNANPYYDDFNEDNNYYKVLFKPGVTVQTRELNNLQSILQDQIEKFGNKFFTNGGIVIPGNFAYDNAFNCVEIESTYKGISVETYLENFVGKTIRGRVTGITAKIEYVLSSSNTESTRKTTAIYVKYQTSSTDNFTTEVFEDGEELVTVEDVYVGQTLFSADSAIFRTISLTDRLSTSVGSAAKIEDGVYFIRGTFVNISKETIILDAYTNTPSYRVGLKVVESIIDSDEDSSLVDNARGFSNYAAPGADRLKIEAFLTKKELDDYNDDDFIELFRVQSGLLIKINQDDPYSFITDVLARRTYDESGNYSVQPVNITAIESLNDNLGNEGQYLSTQITTSGKTPSNDLAVLKVSPGKSYVKGYEVPTPTNLIDYVKPRTTKSVESSSSNFRAGNILKVNNITGIPKIGITTDSSILLYKSRLNSSNLPSTSDEIGVCRIYDFEYDNNSYENPSSQSNVYMFDIQTYTKLETNSTLTGISTGDYIKGNYSDASGYVNTYSNNVITLYQVSGAFIRNESLSICGITSTSTIGTVTDYSIQDIKSISDENNSFTADSSLTDRRSIDGPFDISVFGTTANITRQDGTSFTTGLKIDDVISYSITGETLPVYVKITSIVSTNSIAVELVDSVPNVCTNTLGTSGTLSSINIIRSQIKNYNDSSFYAPLEKSNISEVSFLNSSIFTKKYYDSLSISGNSMTLPSLVATDFVYAPFDEERYCLVNSDTNENIELTEDNLVIGSGGKTASFISLPVASANARIITTQIKSNISSKYKKLERCKTVTLTRTKFNPVPSGSGLSYSKVYGTRVEDQELSLNYPDIFEVHGVFQSSTSNSPELPSLTISGLNTADINLGEVFIGQTSGAVAICAEKLSSSSISFVYKSQNTFSIGEQIKFTETETEATVINSTAGEPNIISQFTIDNGQRKYFYDIGKLIRREPANQVSKKIKIVFDYFKFESTDYGDVVSVNSYPSNLYGEKIAVFEEIRNTDVIDNRPRVADYNTGSSLSPFEYASRSFATQTNNPTQVLKSNESIIFDFNYYLPRTDKLTLDKNGNFEVVLGEPSDSPETPLISEEVLDVATVRSLAYVFNTSDIEIELTDNRRYTMSDIRDIDRRVENLEFTTSLSLLEVATQNLLIEDQDGFNRFKCGFFVDNFGSDDTSDTTNELYNARIQNNTLSADIEETYVGLDTSSITNLRLTGNSLTIDYSEVEYQKQNFASRIVNINPFNIVTWSGGLSLSPGSDKWEIIIRKKKRKHGNKKDKTVRSSVPIKYIRSRNIAFTGIRLKPRTQYDFSFDSRNLSDGSVGSTYAFPKLVAISNVTGTFSIGETVKGHDSNGNRIVFKLCAPNHKFGPIENPIGTYNFNPYTPSSPLPTLYGPESTVLNVDVHSLQTFSDGELFGNITVGMILYGQESNAFATVSSVKLISDENGTLSGSMFIPPVTENGLKYETGNTTARLSTSQSLLGIPGETESFAESNFVSEGETVTLTRIKYYDPLAQTFNVPEGEGVFITSVNIFFQSKDPFIPVELQIREVSSGIPGGPDKIVKNLSKTLNPNEVNISNDGLAVTNFKFDNLTKLEGGREYAIVLISDSNEYNVWVSRLGEVEISTASLPDIQKVIVNKQPSLGSLFKSQNGTTWVPTPEEDLKFTLNRAEFSTVGGTAIFTNSIVPTKSIQNKLPNDPIVSLSVNSQSPYNDGRHIRVNHPNHGMHSQNNFVEISGVKPDLLPVNLDQSLLYSSSGPITLSSTADFGSFDGSAVDPSNNPGYVLINDEIIRYTAISGNQLTGITRGQFGTTAITHPLNSNVYKYEFSGVSLAAINTTFEQIIDPSIDQYYVQINPNYSTFDSEKIGGGDNAYASKNIQFSGITLNEDLIQTYQSTTVSSSVRTVSSTSVNGTEVSFADNGYQEISPTTLNRFDTPRMVCSRINEQEYLASSQFNNNKSLAIQLNLKTDNSRVSPLINIENASAVVQNYRINQPIEEYPTDPRVNSNVNDPNAFIHMSKRINLSAAATSLKVFLSVYRHYSSDIRVLYKIFRDDNVDEDQNWQLFPGYLNLDVNNRIINSDNNDGRSDEFVPESLSNEYRDYSFSIDNLPSFTGYAIKIVGTTVNQAYSPFIKDLRAIALK